MNQVRDCKLEKIWSRLKESHPVIAQFVVFFLICNGITVLQMVLMPILKWLFGFTGMVDISFQWLQTGENLNGTPYYVFDYAAGSIADGGGGGLAYFLAVEFTMAIAQIINFTSQRKVTFKAKGNVWSAAVWYVLAYLVITIGASALQGLYKVPIYTWLIGSLGNGTGTIAADIITMLINCTISFWVFFPLMKWIFKK